MSTNQTTNTHPSVTGTDIETDTPAAGASTAETIRQVLRRKANSETTRGRGTVYGGNPKPPQPPPGTRRSMGKR